MNLQPQPTIGRALAPADKAAKHQTTTIFALGRCAKLKESEVLALCASKFMCRPSELSKWAAQEMVDELRAMLGGKG